MGVRGLIDSLGARSETHEGRKQSQRSADESTLPTWSATQARSARLEGHGVEMCTPKTVAAPQSPPILCPRNLHFPSKTLHLHRCCGHRRPLTVSDSTLSARCVDFTMRRHRIGGFLGATTVFGVHHLPNISPM